MQASFTVAVLLLPKGVGILTVAAGYRLPMGVL